MIIWGAYPIDLILLEGPYSAQLSKRPKVTRFAHYLSTWCLIALSFTTILLITLSSLAAHANEPLSLDTGSNFYLPLTEHIEGFVDETGSMDFDAVLENQSSFKKVTTKYPDYGLSTGRVWFRTRVVNNTSENRTWRLDINRQYYSELAIYKKEPSKPYERLLFQNNKSSFADRDIPNRMLVQDFEVKAGEQTDLYIAFKSDSTTYMPLGIGTVEGATLYRSKENTLNWVLNGALIAIIAFTLMMMPVIKWRVSSSFAAYIFAGLVYVFHADGYTFQYLWPQQRMAINDPLNLSFMALMPVFGLTFSRAMFNFKKHAPWFDRYLVMLVSFAFVVALFSMKIYETQTLKVIAYLVPPIGAVTQVAAGYIAVRRKLSGAIPYLIGATIVMVSFLYAFIAHAVPGQYSLDATLDFGHFALFTECLAFATAIVVRLSGIRRERDQARQAELVSAQEKLKLSATLQKAQEDYIHARKLSDSRREQLSNLSHDIQQPLASLRSTIMNLDGADEEKVQKMQNAFDYLETIARSNIKTTPDNPPTSDGSIWTETFPLRAVLDNVHQMFIDEADSKGLAFSYDAPRVNVSSDPVQLMRAVSNLISNAIQHTNTGEIRLNTKRESGRLKICIEDTGEGMSKEQQDRMLLRNNKGDKSTGTGLGLAIVQEISETLGLEFELFSAPGKGTRAQLSFPKTI